jgi:hypothetical protein
VHCFRFRQCSGIGDLLGTAAGERHRTGLLKGSLLELRAKGDGILKIGKKLGIGTSVVQRVVAAN